MARWLSGFFSVNKSDMTITCANGYQAIFRGLDDVEKIKSTTAARGVLTDVWIEEATECKREDVKTIIQASAWANRTSRSASHFRLIQF